MTKNINIKKPLPTKAPMARTYENNLCGGQKSEFYSGLGSHHPEIVYPYIDVEFAFLKDFKTPPINDYLKKSLQQIKMSLNLLLLSHLFLQCFHISSYLLIQHFCIDLGCL